MLQEYFEQISDPRQQHKVKHNLLEIVIMTICAVIAECEAWYQVVGYCQEKESWIREKLGLKLKNGIASHDTFERIFSMIEPKALENSFVSWTKAVNRITSGDIVSIDGKTLCASADTQQRAIHMVSAWASKNRLVLGQVKTDKKSNEITAIPELLELLELKGCIVTIDAMGCQKKIAEKVVSKQADYVFGLKGNQTLLHEDVALYFKNAFENRKLYPEIDSTGTYEKGHGRIEKRTYYLSDKIDWLESKKDWANLSGIGMVSSEVLEKGQIKTENRYFITSLTDVMAFAKAVRGHWGIENSLHWVLDVAFHEDNCRIRKDNSGENFAVIRHIAVNLLKQDDAKMSMKAKRHRCAYSDAYLHKILFQSFGF